MTFHHFLFSCIWRSSISRFFIAESTLLRETQSEITNNHSALISFVLFISVPEERPQQGNASTEHICFTAETRLAPLLNHCARALFEHFLTFKWLHREETQAFLLDSTESWRKACGFPHRNTWDSHRTLTLFILTEVMDENVSMLMRVSFGLCRSSSEVHHRSDAHTQTHVYVLVMHWNYGSWKNISDFGQNNRSFWWIWSVFSWCMSRISLNIICRDLFCYF